MAASHMMARTRSSHQTLKKRLLKQARPYNDNTRVKTQLDSWDRLAVARPLEISDVSRAVGTRVSDASWAPTTTVNYISCSNLCVPSSGRPITTFFARDSFPRRFDDDEFYLNMASALSHSVSPNAAAESGKNTLSSSESAQQETRVFVIQLTDTTHSCIAMM